MSVVDASIFRTHQLFELELKYRFVEDVWLSYVVKQLPHWRIGRLNVKFDYPGQEFSRKTGQFQHLRDLKDQMFRDLGYLRCGGEVESTNLSASSALGRLDTVSLP